MQRHMECCIRETATADLHGAHHWFVSKVPETWQTRVEMLRVLEPVQKQVRTLTTEFMGMHRVV
jgi:hypothetical protein